jgi:hypothetical protein
MRVFTNKYFPLHNYNTIYNYLKQSISILKYDNKVYVPLIVNKIDYKIINIKNQSHTYIPNTIKNYKSKFIYINNDFYDLIDERDLKFFKIDNKTFNLDKEIKRGDIILLEDAEKFYGLY